MPSMPEMTLDVVKSFVKMLGSERCTISVLGGEPSLHKDFNKILDLLLGSNHEEIIVLSNGTVPLEPVPGVQYSLTLHKCSERQYKTFLENCQKIKENAELVIELTEENQDIQGEFSENVRELWIDAKPSHIFAENVHSPFYYLNGAKVSAEQVLKMGLNRFKGWSCLVHDFAVYGDGTIKPACTNSKIPIRDFNPSLDYVIKCPNLKCAPECMLESIKFKAL